VDDIGGHCFGDRSCRGVELCGDDAGEDVSFGDDACDFVEGVFDDERADAVLVHEFGGLEGGVGVLDGVDAFDTVCAMIAFGPVFFVCEELCDGLHDRFLSTPQSEEGVVKPRVGECGRLGGLVSSFIMHILD